MLVVMVVVVHKGGWVGCPWGREVWEALEGVVWVGLGCYLLLRDSSKERVLFLEHFGGCGDIS